MKKRKTIKRITAPRLAKRGGPRFSFKKGLPVIRPAKLVKLKEPAEEMAGPTFVPRDSDSKVVENERNPYDGNTAFNLYLREVGQTKLLTIQEENELAARIKKGDRKAREQMIKANLRLVVKIAREYEDYGMPLLDLINEGNIGLMKAV
ncbi:MAG TPA: sigma-70 factor domain-containing protein, partial [Verrucomicrobiae bacterium]|nr:sigma-70 factor domain-containing protein [Verrucomicrobiae bacterium]